jgi:hypothetical protein
MDVGAEVEKMINYLFTAGGEEKAVMEPGPTVWCRLIQSAPAANLITPQELRTRRDERTSSCLTCSNE